MKTRTAVLAFALLLAVGLVAVAGPSSAAVTALGASQISDAAGPGPEATRSAVAYNETDNQFLVVWEQENAAPNGKTDMIFGRILDDNNTPVTAPFAISTPDTSDNNLGAGHPAVAWSATGNQYLVVWEGDHTARGDFEIWAQRLTASGTLLGDSIQVSVTVDGAHHPDVAADGNGNYLIAWDADNDAALVDVEICTLILDTAGTPGVGIQLSFMSNPATNRTAFAPAVAWNPTDTQYLVCWTSDGGAGLSDNQFEIFARRVDSNGVGINVAYQVSEMSAGLPDRDGFDATVVHNNAENDFFVVWNGDGDGPGDVLLPLAADQYEVFGQTQKSDGTVVTDDFQITIAGAAGADRDSYHPAATYNSVGDFYLAFSEADGGALANDVFEVFVRRVETGGIVAAPNVQVSTMSAAGANRDARLSGVDYNSTNDEYLVTWNGDGLAQPDNDDEVFGHMSELQPVPVLFTGLHVRSFGDGAEIAWSVYADEAISGFRVYRSEGDGPAVNLVEGDLLAPDAREYFDGGVRVGASYNYVIGAVKPDGSEILSPAKGFQPRPIAFELSQNYPNPFNPTTTIRYALPAPGQVSITIFDVTGAQVARLVDETSPAGVFEVQWHGRNHRGLAAASGTYFYRIVARLDDGRSFSQVKKLVLAK